MNKKTEYALKGAGIGALGGIIINAISQLFEMDRNPQKKFDWGEMFTTGLKGAALGAGGGFLIGAAKDHLNTLEEPIDTNAFIFSMINDIKLKKTDVDYIRLDKKADNIQQIICDYFKDKIDGTPLRGGSTENGTALKESFDIDIYFPFKANSFSSIDEMYEALFDFLKNNYSENGFTELRRQGKSIGVLFTIHGKEYKIDIVPYKVSSNAKENTTGYLCVTKDSIYEKSSYVKTDIKKLKSIKLSPTQQKIFVLLKNWKKKNNIPLKSYLLQRLIVKAYAKNRHKIPRDISKKTIMILNFIAESILRINIKGAENTNNILTDMPESNKKKIKDACIKIIKDYEYQPNSLIEAFK